MDMSGGVGFAHTTRYSLSFLNVPILTHSLVDGLVSMAATRLGQAECVGLMARAT